MPPRHGKSTTVSEHFPAWYLGRNPSDQVLFSTYGQNLASSFGRRVRNQLFEPTFRSIFPNCHISSDSKAINQFTTQEGGIYNAVGRGGPITGKGANIVILDDMLKDNKDAESKIIREGFKDWYRSTLITRLEPDAAIIFIATRWQEDDPIGFVLNEFADDGWEQIILPALSQDETIALWSERYPVKRLLKIKKGLTPYFWNALYQQRPSAREGNILKREWWKFYKELPKRFDKVIQSWDMSFKKGETNSFVIGQVWGKLGPDNYLIHQFRRQIGFTDTLRAFSQLTKNYPEAYRKLVEDKANGPAIMDALKNKISGIIPIEPEGSKEERASAISPIIESGNVYLPDQELQPWILEFIDECANFPKGTYDDQVDGMTQALSDMNDSATTRLEKLLAD